MLTDEQTGRAATRLTAKNSMTARSKSRRTGRARGSLNAEIRVTVPSDTIDGIRLKYRLAKTAEDTRNRLGGGITALARTYASGWDPTASLAERKETAAAAKRIVKHVLRAQRPDIWSRYPDVLAKVELSSSEETMLKGVQAHILDMAAPWWLFEMHRDLNRVEAERLARTLPAWSRLDHIKGFTIWGLVTIIGEFGDLTDNLVPEAERKSGHRYSGVRRIYKRLGLAPDECYPTGEKSKGRKIPRSTRGRIMGIIADTLLKHQWAGERGPEGEKLAASGKGDPTNIPAHPTGPYGAVYGKVKASHLAQGKKDGHADKVARRAMVKALIHDVHLAWHGEPLEYAAAPDKAA